MRSSYKAHRYDEKLQWIIRRWKPLVAVELGVLDGFSTVAIAKGLQHNHHGHLDAYDLFEKYPYSHGSQSSVRQVLDEAGVTDQVTLHQGDAYQVHVHYGPESIQFLHVDISNDGDVVRRIMELWDPKLDTDAMLCFEGGSEERDQVDWMVKYQRPSIRQEIESNPIIRAKYVYGTYLQFPSMTCLLKKRS